MSDLLKPLSELANFKGNSAPGPTGITVNPDGSIAVTKRPNRPNHICVGCKNFFEYVRLKEPGPRATGVFHAEWISYCSAKPSELIDINEDTILLCTDFKRINIVERIRRSITGKKP